MSRREQAVVGTRVPGMLIGAAMLSTLAGVGADDPANVATVLAKVRSAIGVEGLERQARGVLVEGEVISHEARGRFRLRFDHRGRFVDRIEGTLSETKGHDGSTAWAVDWSGMPLTLELFDREWTLLATWVRTGQWLGREAAVVVELDAGASDADVVALTVGPRGGRLRARLRIDRATWLPRSLTRPGAQGDLTWEFADFREVSGLKLPARTTLKQGEFRTHVYTMATAGPSPDDEADPYRPATSRPADAHFDKDAPARLVVKRAATGHVLVRPRVDGDDLGWFILDTGGGGPSVIGRDAAARSRWPVLGSMPLTSIFGTAPSAIRRAKSLQLGPLTIADPILLEMDLEPLSKAFGLPVAGIIGYDLFSRCVAVLELADDAIELHEVGDDRQGAGHWRDLVLHRRHPLVPATVEGRHQGLVTLDIGAAGGPAGGVVFFAPAVESLHLLDGRKVARGKAGRHAVGFGEIGQFELAGRRFDRPKAVFALDRSGPFADEYALGAVGVEMLKPFRVVLDYAHRRIALVERAEEGR
jgi:hypothetical protein